MSMSEPRRQACMKITRKLMQFPCARIFLHPVDTTGKTDYNDVIKSPQDLTSIYSRLVKKEYPTVESWEHDLVLIWYNCERYNGHDSVPYLLAQRLNDHYKKLRERYLIYTFPLWFTQLSQLKTKLDKFVAYPPPQTKGKMPLLTLPRERSSQFRENDYQLLYKNLQKMKSPADTLYFVNIFYRNEPQIAALEDPLSVDLRTLSYESLMELKRYTRKRCQEMGLKYE